MAILFNVVSRKNLQDPTAAPKFYITLVSRMKKDLEQLCDRISQNSTLSKGEIKNVVESLVEEISYQLMEGNSVELGKLGTLRLTAHSDGADEMDKATSSLVKDVKIRYRAGSDLANKVKSIKFEKVPNVA